MVVQRFSLAPCVDQMSGGGQNCRGENPSLHEATSILMQQVLSEGTPALLLGLPVLALGTFFWVNLPTWRAARGQSAGPPSHDPISGQVFRRAPRRRFLRKEFLFLPPFLKVGTNFPWNYLGILSPLRDFPGLKHPLQASRKIFAPNSGFGFPFTQAENTSESPLQVDPTLISLLLKVQNLSKMLFFPETKIIQCFCLLVVSPLSDYGSNESMIEFNS